MGPARRHLYHHGRFYAAMVAGALLYVLTPNLLPVVRFVAAGDLFFVTYLVLSAIIVLRISADELCDRAAQADEGIFVVLVLSMAIIATSCYALIAVLDQHSGVSLTSRLLAVAGAPLGWLTLHVIASFHYANIYYWRSKGSANDGGLSFPETKTPGVWEFIYYALTIGLTAQTSDVSVTTTKMRRATLGHAVVSFFFNAAIVAMAVNAVIIAAS